MITLLNVPALVHFVDIFCPESLFISNPVVRYFWVQVINILTSGSIANKCKCSQALCDSHVEQCLHGDHE